MLTTVSQIRVAVFQGVLNMGQKHTLKTVKPAGLNCLPDVPVVILFLDLACTTAYVCLE